MTEEWNSVNSLVVKNLKGLVVEDSIVDKNDMLVFKFMLLSMQE